MKFEQGYYYERVKLTKKQCEQLRDINKILHKSFCENKTGTLVAQVYPGNENMLVVFVDREKTKKIQRIINPPSFHRLFRSIKEWYIDKYLTVGCNYK